MWLHDRLGVVLIDHRNIEAILGVDLTADEVAALNQWLIPMAEGELVVYWGRSVSAVSALAEANDLSLDGVRSILAARVARDFRIRRSFAARSGTTMEGLSAMSVEGYSVQFDAGGDSVLVELQKAGRYSPADQAILDRFKARVVR